MTIKPQFHWIFRLRSINGRKGRVVHLAASDENGLPLSTTICGRSYDPADRTDASRGIKTLTGQECTGCLRQLGDSWSELHKLLLAGRSEMEAAALVDDILKLRRTSKQEDAKISRPSGTGGLGNAALCPDVPRRTR